MKIRANAKINLSLDVLYKRADGYHELRTVMASLPGLFDELVMEEASRVSVDCSEPLPEDNTAYRAASLFSERFGCGGARIRIAKRIPSQAGLGGASADAAAVLRGMQSLYGYPASEAQLYALAYQLGADVPFCLHGGICFCEGIGEKLKPLSASPALNLVLLKGKAGVSTAALFQGLPERKATRRGLFQSLRVPVMRRETAAMLASLRRRDLRGVAGALHNDLQAPAEALVPEIGENLARLRELGALGVSMSGSGACVFGIFADKAAARAAYEALEDAPFALCGEI